MYTIKHAAQRVGITTATLRAWERRYGVITPHRSESGYRLYGDHDVAVLLSMKHLVDQGWSVGLAAAEALRLDRDHPVQDKSLGTPDDGRATNPIPDLAGRLTAAASALDTTDLAGTLNQVFALGSFETVMTDHVFPALENLGDAWADGQVSVAGEHLASNAVMRRLAVAYEAASAHGHGPRVALGLAPHTRHEIGLLAFAVAARRRGMDTDYLGADLPLDDWLGVVDDPELAAVVLAIPTTADITATGAVISALCDRRPDLVVAVGGAQQDHAPERAIRLGHDITAGAKILAASTSSRQRPDRNSTGAG
ncbi:MerR family transcriptional regulator [Nocardioides albus]|uniref:DNA-binding transcriptional MerR regulator n=1 Tax=Nocardioides albus TaxID=1841 RepID=A0A7W5A376_9ACTN|nr:MerR family transcriptional regulator [Nocardioides albus]MBB3088635.1 DNA-binding transcriptional MerR regulator [Nocardioides albus]GGU17602.1 MerR family transcriptional regulator [Nocardioides albus]